VFYSVQIAGEEITLLRLVSPGLVAALAAVAVYCANSMAGRGSRSLVRSPWVSRALPALLVISWAVVNGGWTVDWLANLSYRQRDADRWLESNLPPGSVLIGAVAPGLCLNNRFVAVSVIERLCNDHLPVERFAPAPRYVLILDGRWRERWWRAHYPAIVAPAHATHHFRRLLRWSFVISVYPCRPDSDAARRGPSGRGFVLDL
jgi:hypothetical protein